MSSVQSENHPLANSRKKTGIILLLLILVCLMTGACGCVRLMQQSGDSGKNVTDSARR